jgi:hypothetical protein
MKEELQGKLVEILTSIQTAAGKASDFALEQLPDIAQSYVAYGRVWSVAALCCWLSVLVVSVLAIRWAYRHPRAGDDRAPFAAGLGGGIMSFVGVIGLMTTAKGAALVWFAPKVWLLKEIATLIK